MCNLYNLTTNQEALRAITRAMTDSLGNLEPTLDVYPDRPAPVVRNTPNGRELALLTWGMPSPPFVTKGNPDTGVTNIRNVASPALEAVAWPGKPLPRPMDYILRVGGHQTKENQTVVRH